MRQNGYGRKGGREKAGKKEREKETKRDRVRERERDNSRVTERICGGTAGREESVRPCGPSSGLHGNETARCEFVLDGSDCCNLEWKLYESAPGDGLVEQSSDEPRTSRERQSLQPFLQ